MESKLINGLYCKKGNVEWKNVSIGLKVDTFAQELIRLKEVAADNNGFLNIDVCTSKDGQKLYAVLNDFKPVKQEQVNSSQHSPDRDSDLPF
tara:strand:+ start:44 stop:319 length:276 start_codon:yes stop_codon:yes gene_type:complete